jgi:hypothetical protein
MKRTAHLAFVFDLIEPERPKMDRAVLAFPKSEALHPADFTILTALGGTCQRHSM